MLYIDDIGIVKSNRITVKIFSKIEHDRMDKVNGIVVHQTNTPSSSHTFNSYTHPKSDGAHFLIDRDGTIYQTASLFKTTWHVGLMQSRCVVTKKCEPAELKKMAGLESAWKPYELHDIEKTKSFPDRFPGNADSIGIEIVGDSADVATEKHPVYETVNNKQNEALKWLISELIDTLDISPSEIYRHPDIGRKNLTEASTASW
ncbi:TPA: N-acetylmuramoyl-L-alanine amidase [Morganella morganii]|nr:N-acetylmuramoyl-L-alanine amidase [Morganella morganii]